MTLEQYAKATELLDKKEIEKVRLLAYYFLRTNKINQFNTTDVAEWFEALGLAAPNRTRLKNNLRKSSAFVRGTFAGTFRLNAKELPNLDTTLKGLVEKSEEIISPDEVLPDALFLGTRGFIEQLARQINACFVHNLFDGCAVLMRRLIEVLLILAFQANGIESKIQKSDGQYKDLIAIIGEAITNKKLDLSKTTRACLDDFRTLGNFSAHQIFYNARRKDIERVLLPFRAAVEELLYKSALKT